jgi:taurine dioxygenase
VIGPVLGHYSTINVISNVRPEGLLGSGKIAFHSDAAYTDDPILAICLHAVTIEEPLSSSTVFASGWRALDALPSALRARVEGLRAMNLAPFTSGSLEDRQRLADYPPEGPRAIHPVVMHDPITQRDMLYLSRVNADHIIGLDPDESEGLIQEIQSYIYAQDNQYEHFWQTGDLVIWSNQGCHHARGARMGRGERTLNRVCVTNAPLEQYEMATSIPRPAIPLPQGPAC